MTRLVRSLVAVVLVLVMATSLLVGPVSARSGARERPVSAPQLLSASRAATLAYWTPERMSGATAKPAASPDRRRPSVTVSEESGRRPSLVDGVGLAHDSADQTLRSAIEPAAYTYPFPYSRYPVASQLRKVAPYKAVGKVFFTQDGGSYVCSAASVTSGPRQVVLTAGHCLNDGLGNWSGDVLFVPAKRGADNPYGRFPARNLWVPSGWADSDDLSFDIGAFNVGRNAKGKTLQSQVGAVGFAYGMSRVQHWDVLAYPAESPFTGKTLQVCEASHAVDDAALGSGPDTMGIGCDFNGGSSGGPWVTDLRRGSYINSVVSYGYDVEPEAVYGPYFDEAVNDLRCAAATGEVPIPPAHFEADCDLP